VRTFKEEAMAWVPIFLALLAGFVLGLVAAFVLRIIQSRTAKQLADELFQESEVQRKANIEAIMDGIKANFGNLSLEALSKSTEQFLVLAKSKLDMEREVNAKELDAKKGLIDEQLKQMTAKLENVSGLVQRLEMDRVEKFGELASQLKSAGEQTAALMQTTNSLREALVSPSQTYLKFASTPRVRRVFRGSVFRVQEG
jgi:DNA recombination protein RmuC